MDLEDIFDFFSSSNRKSQIEEEQLQRHKLNQMSCIAAIEAIKQQKNLADQIKVRNSDFSETAFTDYAVGFFENFLNTRMTYNLDSVRHCLTKDFYQNMCSAYLAQKEKNEAIIIKKYEVLSSSLISYKEVNSEEYIEMRLINKYMAYFVDANTQDYIRGNRYDAEQKCELLTFMKNKNYDKSKEKSRVCCPNCGAPLDEVYINVCKFCNTVVPLPEKEWLLCKFKESKVPIC